MHFSPDSTYLYSDPKVTSSYSTVGAIIFETLVFVNFSACGASIFKISVPIMKRRSWGFQNTPNLRSLDNLEPSYCNLKKKNISKTILIFNLIQNTSESSFFSKQYFFGIAITWVKIIQTLQVWGVLESSGPPPDDGHRDFEDWCTVGWEIDNKGLKDYYSEPKVTHIDPTHLPLSPPALPGWVHLISWNLTFWWVVETNFNISSGQRLQAIMTDSDSEGTVRILKKRCDF